MIYDDRSNILIFFKKKQLSFLTFRLKILKKLEKRRGIFVIHVIKHIQVIERDPKIKLKTNTNERCKLLFKLRCFMMFHTFSRMH